MNYKLYPPSPTGTLASAGGGLKSEGQYILSSLGGGVP